MGREDLALAICTFCGGKKGAVIPSTSSFVLHDEFVGSHVCGLERKHVKVRLVGDKLGPAMTSMYADHSKRLIRGRRVAEISSKHELRTKSSNYELYYSALFAATIETVARKVYRGIGLI